MNRLSNSQDCPKRIPQNQWQEIRLITPRRGVNQAVFLPLRFFDDKMSRKTATNQPKSGANRRKPAKITHKTAETRSEGRGGTRPSARKSAQKWVKLTKKQPKRAQKRPKEAENSRKQPQKRVKTAQKWGKSGAKVGQKWGKVGAKVGQNKPKTGSEFRDKVRPKQGQKRHQKNGASWVRKN